jgi:hypothetical protein
MIRKYSIVLVAAASILAAAIFLFVPFKTVVTVTNAQTRQPILYLQLSEGEEFIIGFTHSVNKRPVYDYVRVDQENLLIVKSRYDAFGAGMPEVAPEGAVLQTVDNILELSNLNLARKEIGLFVGTVANHTLTVKGNTLALTDIVPPGTHLKFNVARISYTDIWKGRCL